MDAITIEERETDAFDEAAMKQHLAEVEKQRAALPTLECGCPGSAVRQMARTSLSECAPTGAPSQLAHWPVQLTLVPPGAPFLQDAELLLVADCVPFAYADFHRRFLPGRPVVIGCPKLDDVPFYVDKLAAIIEQSSIRSLTIIHMEVPCCTGLCRIAETAMETAPRAVPVKEITVSVDGRVIAEKDWRTCTTSL